MVGQFRRQAEGGGEGLPNMDTILVTAEEIASGMAFLHSQGVIHGDLTGGAYRNACLCFKLGSAWAGWSLYRCAGAQATFC